MSYDAIIVGAGVFGAWTAVHLQRAGKRVLLVDAAGPAHARASSGGESRLTRSLYGADAIYSRMAAHSLDEWRRLSDASSLPLFHKTGALFFFAEEGAYVRDSIAAHEELGLPLQILTQAELTQRWPQIDFAGVALGLYQPAFGALMARRAVQELVRGFVRAGGDYRLAHARPSATDNAVLVDGVETRADAIVFACGPWLGKLFPEILGARLFITRQEIAFLAPPDGDDRFEPHASPCWAEHNGQELFYGFPNLETRGFKLACDRHGPLFDPDTGDRRMSGEGMEVLRAYLRGRFPALAERPFTEFRVCQYENSANGDFLMDRHPTLDGVWLLGAGSGHGFKHGPEVGRMMADLVLGRAAPEPRFALATKGDAHRRSVV